MANDTIPRLSHNTLTSALFRLFPPKMAWRTYNRAFGNSEPALASASQAGSDCQAQIGCAIIAAFRFMKISLHFTHQGPPFVIDIRLTPAGSLRWEIPKDTPEDQSLPRVRETFTADWRAGLFYLAANKVDTSSSPSLRYWQGIAESFLTRLCHLPQDTPVEAAERPSETELAQWILSAPPMPGGEYLSAEILQKIWEAISEWCAEAAHAAGNVQTFLEDRAPKWHQVGRVCFHLAET